MTVRLTPREKHISASRRDRGELIAGGVGRRQQGLDPTGGTRLASNEFALCHMRKNYEKRYKTYSATSAAAPRSAASPGGKAETINLIFPR